MHNIGLKYVKSEKNVEILAKKKKGNYTSSLVWGV